MITKENHSRLLGFGFEKQGENYIYSTPIAQGQMKMTVTIPPSGAPETCVTDTDTGEEYTLHLVPGAVGSFVGQIREEYQNILDRIQSECFGAGRTDPEQTAEILTHIRETYGDEPEYLWESSPNSAAIRRKDCGKWYAVLLRVSRKKLGMQSDSEVDVLDLKAPPQAMPELIARPGYYPGYHMNKKHWFTVCLDGSLPTAELLEQIDRSYCLADPKKKEHS